MRPAGERRASPPASEGSVRGGAAPAQLIGWIAAASIVVLSTLPHGYEVRTGAASEVEHLGAYALAACLLGLGYPRGRSHILLLLTGGALALEVAQALVPGRTARLLDVAVSFLGALVGLLACRVVERRPELRSASLRCGQGRGSGGEP